MMSLKLLNQLLAEQQTLTFVDSFSKRHDRGIVEDHTEPAQARYYRDLLPSKNPEQGEQLAFEVDLDACSGCKACVTACHNLNGLEADESWRRVGYRISHSLALPMVQHVTTACHHCAEPGCLQGCPVQAYEKDPLTGIVRHLDDQCFGCKYCTMMCPYEVPQYSSRLGIVRKCDMCWQRMREDEAPACVQACPNQAIRIRIVPSSSAAPDDPDRSSHFGADTNVLVTAPPASWTRPTTRYVTKRSDKKIPLVDSSLLEDHPQEGHLPLVAMLVLSQMSVGMFGISWCGSAFADFTAQQIWEHVLVASLIGLVGIHLALLHLGRPHLAPRAFLGWRTSWLSREALIFGLYMGLMVLSATSMMIPQFCSGKITNGLLATTFLIGLGGVYASSMIYVATKRSLWNTKRTFLQFFGSTIALGIAGSAAILAWSTDQSTLGRSTMAMASIIFSVASLSPLLQAFLAGGRPPIDWDDFVSRSGRLLRGKMLPWVVLLSAVHLLAWLASLCAVHVSVHSMGITLSAIMLVGAQLLGRYLYFASVVTYRMPGSLRP